MLDHGHMASDLALCKNRFNFTCENSVTFAHLQNNQSIVSGKNNSADLIEVVHKEGIKVV